MASSAKNPFAVGIVCAERGVVEWEEQRLGIRDPSKARRADTGAHFDTVGEHDVYVHLVEHPLGILLAFGVDEGLFALREHFRKGTGADRKSTRLNSSHVLRSRMPSSA